MFWNLFVITLVVICFAALIFYKRQMVLKTFSFRLESSTTQFQEQIEETADLVIQRLEEKIAYLEELLEEADVKIAKLDARITMTEKETAKNSEAGILFHKLSKFSEKEVEEKSENSSSELNLLQISDNDDGDDNKDKDSARIHKRNSVLALAKKGYSSVEIAKNTGISKSEIMLLLQLHKNR